MAVTRYAVSFLVRLGNRDPEEVTRLFGIKPTHSHKAGDPHIASRGRVCSPYRVGLWELKSSIEESKDFKIHLKHLMRKLKKIRSKMDALERRGCKYEFSIGVFLACPDGGFTLDKAILKSLGDLGAEVWFDVYGGDEKEKGE